MQLGLIYARYSCEKQTENSILGQIRECMSVIHGVLSSVNSK